VRLTPPAHIPLEGDEQGEIQVRSEATARGYLADGVITPCHDGDGWYGTRDAGRRDEQNRLWVGRRLRDPIVVGDVSVRPETVERALAAMPGVREVIAVPARDEHGQPALKVVVVAPETHVADIRSWCRDRLPAGAEPTFVELRDELPRSPAGKILLKYLVSS
jgi:long-chain acyl-CoA synthetase